jgi:hypothetical protein
MVEIKLYKSPWKALKLILLCLPFVAASLYFIIHNDYDKTGDWIGLCFFGLGIPFAIFNLLDKRPELVLNHEGIFDRRTYGTFNKNPDRGFVKWDAINDVYLKIYVTRLHGLPTSKQKYVCIKLKENSAAFLSDQHKPRKFLQHFGFGDYNIPLMGLKKIDEQKLVDFIKSMAGADNATRQRLLLSSEL